MLCPVMSYGYTKINCEKEECTWYNRNKEECCIKVLTENIKEVAEGQRVVYIREV